MRIIRNKQTGRIENLYYISPDKNLTRKQINPTVPNNFITASKDGDLITKRIRLYTTIEDALSGLFIGQNIKGQELTVYRAKYINPTRLYGPASISEVPYALKLNEWWYLSPLEFEKVKDIIITTSDEQLEFRYGSKKIKGTLIRWKWKELKDDYKKK